VNAADVADQTHGAYVENPNQSACASSGSYCAGASTAVTPMPRLLVMIAEASFLIGLAVFFEELFSDDWDTDHKTTVEYVHRTIDYNNYLPTTYDDYRSWPTVAGTGYEGPA